MKAPAFVYVLLSLLFCAGACCGNTEKAKNLESDQVQLERQKQIEGLAVAFGADQQWNATLDDFSKMQVFTVDAQRALTKAGGKPVVITGRLDDVASPYLFEPECKTPRQIQLANALCRFREMAKALVI